MNMKIVVNCVPYAFYTYSTQHVHTFTLKKKMLGCFKPNFGKIWTNPDVGLKM